MEPPYKYLLVPFIESIFTTYSIPNYYIRQQVSGNMYDNTCFARVTARYSSFVCWKVHHVTFYKKRIPFF